MVQRRGDALAKRVLHPVEWEEYQGSNQKVAFLAKRIAAKEAAAKALGTGMAEGVGWQQIRVSHDNLGAPRLIFTEAAAQRAEAMGVTSTHLSLSDEKQFAVAFAMLEASA